MGKRTRAIITRIQTMRTSSLVGLAITIGLLVVYYFKQSDYEDRMSEKRHLKEKQFLQTIQLQKEILPEKHPLIPIVDDADNTTQGPTEGTIPDSVDSGEDDDYEQDEKDYSEDDDDDGDDDYDEEDKYDDEENDDEYSDNKAGDYDDEEEDVDEQDDDGDEEDFAVDDDGDDDVDKNNDEEDVEDYDNDEEEDDYDDMVENVIDSDDDGDEEDVDDDDELDEHDNELDEENDGGDYGDEEDVDDDDELDEENDDELDDADEYEEEDSEDSEDNTTTAPIESDDDEDMEENVVEGNVESDTAINDGSDYETDDNKDGDVVDNSTNAVFEDGKTKQIDNDMVGENVKETVDIVINNATMENFESKNDKNQITHLGEKMPVQSENAEKLSQSLNLDNVSAVDDDVTVKNVGDNGYQDIIPQNNFDHEEIIPQKLSIEDNEVVKKDLEMLSKKYPETLEDSSLKTQTDNYIVRLRNKLKQIGRLDVIYKNHCTKRLPKSIIIGVMKCGTEAFSTFLGIHPQIAMQFGYTAMEFFSNSALYKKGLDWYKSRMMCSNHNQVTMEKSPQYFSAMAAPERIYRMDEAMKIILLVRDPISRAVSHFLQQQNSHPERLTATTFEDSVYDRERRQVIGSSQYIFQSTYSIIYKRWLKYFPSRQILVVDGDTFKNNPFRSLRKVERFLNIEAYIDETKLAYNEEKKFFCLQPQSDDQEDIAMSCLQGGKGRSHPDIEPEVLNALREYFKPFNEEFIRLTGMRFDW